VTFEELTWIHKRIPNLPKFQRWVFKKVRTYTAYKLERYGVTVDTTKLAYRSQACSRTDCDSTADNNREGTHFE
jgi:transposase